MSKRIMKYQAYICMLIGLLFIIGGFSLGHFSELKQMEKMQQQSEGVCKYFLFPGMTTVISFPNIKSVPNKTNIWTKKIIGLEKTYVKIDFSILIPIP